MSEIVIIIIIVIIKQKAGKGKSLVSSKSGNQLWLTIIRVPPEVLREKYLVRVPKICVSTSTSATGAVGLSQDGTTGPSLSKNPDKEGDRDQGKDREKIIPQTQ